MVKKNLLPSLWKGTSVPVSKIDSPLSTFQQRMNDLFDDFFRGFPLAGALDERMGAFYPSIDVKEGDKEIVVKAELPGLEEKDIEILLADDALTIKGEKKEEKEDKGKNYYHMERTYGSFHRVIPLPTEVESEKVEATFKNGVLSVVLPKTAKTKAAGKKITVKTD
jgi:HSP20 family protein